MCRPATAIDGFSSVPALAILYPINIAPNLFIAIEPIQRSLTAPGSNVAFWYKNGRKETVGSAGFPSGLRISNQRIAELRVPAPSGSVDIFTSKLSTPPRFLKARRYIKRLPSVSKRFVVPGWATHVPPVPLQGNVKAPVGKATKLPVAPP